MKKMTMKMLVMLVVIMMISAFAMVALCEEVTMEEVTLPEISAEEILVEEIPEEEPAFLETPVEKEDEKIVEKEGTELVSEEINKDDIIEIMEEEAKDYNVSIKLVSKNNKVFLGDEVKLVAEPEVACQLQWQCSRDGGMTWEDAVGETGQEMTIILSKANADNIWRVEASF